MIPTVACVYKTGVFMNRSLATVYSPESVRWLQAQVARHLKTPYEFVCLTDYGPIQGVRTIPLPDDWPGWWAKMCLFKPGLFTGKTFYIDLDMVIVDDITAMVRYKHRFSILKNLSREADVRFQGNGRLGSAVMAWRPQYVAGLYERFAADPARHMAENTTPRRWGDQGFIQSNMKKWDYIQDQFPGSVVSYKFHMKQQGDPPPGCKIVAFHGKPKPQDVWEKHLWIPKPLT
jgi:hypothetical protein